MIAQVKMKRKRGNTKPIRLQLSDKRGEPLDITGATFRLAVNTEKAPIDITNQKFEVAGVIIDDTGGVVEFPLSANNADQTPGTYYVEVEMVSDGIVTTVLTGTILWVQNIVH